MKLHTLTLENEIPGLTVKLHIRTSGIFRDGPEYALIEKKNLTPMC